MRRVLVLFNKQTKERKREIEIACKLQYQYIITNKSRSKSNLQKYHVKQLSIFLSLRCDQFESVRAKIIVVKVDNNLFSPPKNRRNKTTIAAIYIIRSFIY